MIPCLAKWSHMRFFIDHFSEGLCVLRNEVWGRTTQDTHMTHDNTVTLDNFDVFNFFFWSCFFLFVYCVLVVFDLFFFLQISRLCFLFFWKIKNRNIFFVIFSERKICRTPRHVFLPLLLQVIFLCKIFRPSVIKTVFNLFWIYLWEWWFSRFLLTPLCFFYCFFFLGGHMCCLVPFFLPSGEKCFFVFLRPSQQTIFDWVNTFLSYSVPLHEIIFVNFILVTLQNPMTRSIFQEKNYVLNRRDTVQVWRVRGISEWSKSMTLWCTT